jgi:hypothetical protein
VAAQGQGDREGGGGGGGYLGLKVFTGVVMVVGAGVVAVARMRIVGWRRVFVKI